MISLSLTVNWVNERPPNAGRRAFEFSVQAAVSVGRAAIAPEYRPSADHGAQLGGCCEFLIIRTLK